MESSPLRDHEKFWAFIVLIAAIVLLALVASLTDGGINETASRILDAAVVGLIGIAGMAAQALFRHSVTEQKLVETVQTQANTASTATPQAVEVVNTESNPAVVKDAAADADGELPESQKL